MSERQVLGVDVMMPVVGLPAVFRALPGLVWGPGPRVGHRRRSLLIPGCRVRCGCHRAAHCHEQRRAPHARRSASGALPEGRWSLCQSPLVEPSRGCRGYNEFNTESPLEYKKWLPPQGHRAQKSPHTKHQAHTQSTKAPRRPAQRSRKKGKLQSQYSTHTAQGLEQTSLSAKAAAAPDAQMPVYILPSQRLPARGRFAL